MKKNKRFTAILAVNGEKFLKKDIYRQGDVESSCHVRSTKFTQAGFKLTNRCAILRAGYKDGGIL